MTPLELVQQEYKSSIYLLAKSLLGYKDVNKKTHGEIISCLESQSKNKLICVPRGCLKTSLLIAYVIWILINNPNARVMIESQTYTLAANILREIKVHLLNKRFIAVFGDWRGNVWNEGEIIISTRTKPMKDPTLKAASVGTVLIGSHFDYILYDDMNSLENINTPENAQKIIDHYKMNTSILEPNGTTVVLGTRYSELDLIGFILENEVKQAS